MNTTVVALFKDPTRAEEVRARLSSIGVRASVNKSPKLRRFWFVSETSGDFRVEVPSEDFRKAEQFLVNLDMAEPIMREAVRCPQCDSFRVDFPQYASHSILPNFFIGLLSQLGFVERQYYCEDCHYEWPRNGHPVKKREHEAPFYFLERSMDEANNAAGDSEERPRKAA